MPNVISQPMHSRTQHPAVLSQSMHLVADFRNVIRELMPLCPVCERSCRGHRYLELGKCSEAGGYERMIHLFRRHRWHDMAMLGAWDATRDGLRAFAVRGEHPLATIALVSSPPKFDSSSWILLQQVVPAQDLLAMESCGLRDWRWV